MRRLASFPVLAALLLFLVGCDHATKYAAVRSLRNQPGVPLVSGVLELRYTENRDVGFSLLRRVPEPVRKPLILVGDTVLVGVFALFWWSRRRAALAEHLGFAFIIAGAVGNLSDRLVRGYVVDFVHLTHWPVFNAADVWLLVGVVLVFFGQRSSPQDEAPSRPAPSPS